MEELAYIFNEALSKVYPQESGISPETIENTGTVFKIYLTREERSGFYVGQEQSFKDSIFTYFNVRTSEAKLTVKGHDGEWKTI